MPKLVNNSQLTVHRNATTVNRELKTVNCRLWRQGFTMIELLIVIAVLGILSSFTIYSFMSAPQKARDAVRKSDLAQVKRALELAKADCQGSAYYPFLGGLTGAGKYTAVGGYLSHPNFKYIPSYPKDPKDPTSYYSYAVSSETTIEKCPNPNTGVKDIYGADNYALWAILERTSDADGVKSREKCKNKPGPAGITTDWTLVTYNGYYVVCNE